MSEELAQGQCWLCGGEWQHYDWCPSLRPESPDNIYGYLEGERVETTGTGVYQYGFELTQQQVDNACPECKSWPDHAQGCGHDPSYGYGGE